MPEEEAFAVLVQIMQQHRMRDMFKPSMSELGICMYQLESLVQEQIPEMHIHFQQQVLITKLIFFILIYLCILQFILGLPNNNVCFQLVSDSVHYNSEFKSK